MSSIFGFAVVELLQIELENTSFEGTVQRIGYALRGCGC